MFPTAGPAVGNRDSLFGSVLHTLYILLFCVIVRDCHFWQSSQKFLVIFLKDIGETFGFFPAEIFSKQGFSSTSFFQRQFLKWGFMVQYFAV